MIQEGHVRVVWINSNDTIATPRYTVTFACYEPPEEFGAQKSKAIVGEADLLRFLQLIKRTVLAGAGAIGCGFA